VGRFFFMTLNNYYYHLLLLIFSLLLITPSYILIYHKFLNLIVEKNSPRPLKIALSIFFTNTILAFIITYLILFKILNQYLSYLILVPGIIYCLKNIKTLQPSITLNFFKVIYMTFVFIFLLSCALPEIGWDALAYHFKLFEPFQFNYTPSFYEAIPKGLDVLFWYSQVLINDTSLAHFFHFSYLLAISFLFYHNICIYFSKPLAQFTSLLVLLLPYGTKISVLGYVDLASACAEIILVFSMINYFSNQNKKNISLMFLATSVALSIKYTSLTLVFSAYLIFILGLFIKNDLRIFIKSLRLQDLVFLILPCLFWYGKNIILYQNPFWPFLFGHLGMSDNLYQQLIHDNLASYTFRKSLLNYFLLPIRFTLYRFQEYNLNGFEIFTIKNLKGIDPTFFCSLIGFYWGLRKKHFYIILPGLIILTNISIVYLFGSHQHRYILGTLYLNIFLFIYFINHFRKYQKIVYSFIIALGVGFFVYGGFFFLLKNSLTALAHPTSFDSYLSSNIHDFDLVTLTKQNNIEPTDISFCFYPLSLFYFKNPKPKSIFDHVDTNRVLSSDFQEILSQLKLANIHYFIINKENSQIHESMLNKNKFWDYLQKEKISKCLELEAHLLKSLPYLSKNESLIYKL